MSFPALSRIKPQAPLLVVPFRQFLQVSALRPYFPRNPDTPVSRRAPPPRPGRRTSRGGAPSNVRRRRRGRHRLRSELRRYLIVFEPPTFALDQRKRPWQTPSLRFVLRRSTNFTSPGAIRMPPSVPLRATSFWVLRERSRARVAYSTRPDALRFGQGKARADRRRAPATPP